MSATSSGPSPTGSSGTTTTSIGAWRRRVAAVSAPDWANSLRMASASGFGDTRADALSAPRITRAARCCAGEASGIRAAMSGGSGAADVSAIGAT